MVQYMVYIIRDIPGRSHGVLALSVFLPRAYKGLGFRAWATPRSGSGSGASGALAFCAWFSEFGAGASFATGVAISCCVGAPVGGSLVRLRRLFPFKRT